MASIFLPVIIDNALEENQELLPVLSRGKAELRRVLTFCDNFRVAGIGALFLTGTSEDFRHHLHQSGRAYASFLSRVDEGAKRLSKSRPFFDAVAAGDYDGAARIARHSRRSWAQGEEYEEDFLFVDFLMKLFFLDAPVGDCEALLERYEACLQGAGDLRLDICKALLRADSEAFNEALARFLEERKDSLEAMSETQTFPEEMLATEWHLSVEGVALARLAERKGLCTEEEYLHVPSLAREDEPISFHEDSWKDIDL